MMEMDIPVINRIGDFEAGISSLQNPSFVSQIFSLSAVSKIHQPYGILKWGALILAFLAYFSTIIHRIKILIFRLHGRFFPAPKIIQQEEYYSYDSDSDSSCSSVSSIAEDQEEEGEEPSVSNSSQKWGRVDEDFSVKYSGDYSDHRWQNSSLRQRRNRSIENLFSSFSEFTNGKSVVKLWDNHISVFDTICNQNLFSIFSDKYQIPAVAVSSSSPGVIVSAESNGHAQLLRVWDARVGGRLPGILAEWTPRLGKIVGIGSDGGPAKVYVRDDVAGRLTLGDIRKLSSPLATCDVDGGIVGVR